MDILYLTQTFPPEPGSTLRALEQAVELQALGHRVTVITAMPNYPLGRVFPAYRGKTFVEERLQGVTVRRVWTLPAPNRGVWRRGLSYLSFAAAAVVAGLLSRRCDLVIARVPHVGTELAAVLIARLRRSRALLELEDLLPDCLGLLGVPRTSLLFRGLSAYFAAIFRLVDLIAVPSPLFASALEARGVSRRRILLLRHGARANAPAADSGHRVRRRLRLEEQFLVVYAGSFSSYYQMPNIVEAARRLESVMPTVHFLLLGTGSDRGPVERMVGAAGLRNVTLAGPVPPAEVSAYLDAADLCLASLVGAPAALYRGYLYTKICDYLMAGRPIVAVEDSPLLGDFLSETGAGRTVPARDPGALASAVAWFATHPADATRCGERGRAYAFLNLRREAIVSAFESDLLRRLGAMPDDAPVRRSVKRILMRANGLIRRGFFSRRTTARVLFGVTVVSPPVAQSYCEWSTVLVRLVLPRYVRPGMRILDLGTGAHAMLAIFIKRRWPGVSLLATDILFERVAAARSTAGRNGVKIACATADMLSGIGGRFDLILFNPPAIPTEELRALGFGPTTHPRLGTRRSWSGDGGPDGLDAIRTFLAQATDCLAPGGRAILGVNPLHARLRVLRPLIEGAGLAVERTHRLPGIVAAHVLTPAAAPERPRASASPAERRPVLSAAANPGR